jgi:thiosulfate reductase cytochrome b subunit
MTLPPRYLLGGAAAVAYASASLWLMTRTPLALIAMFAGEYWLRFRLHPEFERSSPRDMIRAYRQSRQAATLPPAGGASR